MPVDEKNLNEEYNLGDSSFDPELDADPGDTKPPVVAPIADEKPNTSRPRGPDGKFLPEKPPDKPKHSPRLTRMAASFGITEGEANEMSGEALEETLYQLHRQVLADRDQSPRQQRAEPTPQPQAQKPEPPKEDDFGLAELEADGIDQKFIGVLKRIIAHASKASKIDALEETIKGMSQREQVRAQESFASRIDRLFSKQSELFGEGRGNKLPEHSPELARRHAVLSIMQGLKSGDMEERYEKATTILFGAKPGKQPEAPPRQPQRSPQNGRLTPEEWNDAALAVPSHRETVEPKGIGRAYKAVASKLRAMGVGEQFDGVEESGLPE